MYMRPMWLLITLLLIMLGAFLFPILKWFTITTINPWLQCLGQEMKNILRHLFGDKIIQNLQAKSCWEFNFNNFPQKTQIYRWIHKFQATGLIDNLNKKAENPQIWQLVNCKISWQCWCGERFYWKGIWKSPFEAVSKKLVFQVHCRIKSIDFCPCHLLWSFWRDMIDF